GAAGSLTWAPRNSPAVTRRGVRARLAPAIPNRGALAVVRPRDPARLRTRAGRRVGGTGLCPRKEVGRRDCFSTRRGRCAVSGTANWPQVLVALHLGRERESRAGPRARRRRAPGLGPDRSTAQRHAGRRVYPPLGADAGAGPGRAGRGVSVDLCRSERAAEDRG